MTYLILAQSETTGRALGAWLELVGERELSEGQNAIENDPRYIIWREPVVGASERGVLAYEDLVARIERAILVENRVIPLNEVVVLVDSVRPADLNPLQEGSTWDGIVAMLLLTFPEIRWAFGVISASGKSPTTDSTATEKEPEFPVLDHSLGSLLTHPRRDPIFDPTGLREWIRDRARKGNGSVKCNYLPERRHKAAAMDEEKTYAYFHAYTAYRFGYRSDVITSWSLAQHLFGSTKVDSQVISKEPGVRETDSAEADGVAGPQGDDGRMDGQRSKSATNDAGREGLHDYSLLLEDMSLNFPDREAHSRLLRLEAYWHKDPKTKVLERQGRAHHLPKLDSTDKKEGSHVRLLVTTGQGSATYSNVLAENRRYLREDKKTGRGGVIFKPAGGMFELWNEAGFLKRKPGCRRRGDASDYVWPPKIPQSSAEDGLEGGHGAPGRMTLIVESLLRRATAIQKADTTVLEDIQGAVLATDAFELLGVRTPTIAAEALTLKHLMEVQAECHFSGVEFHFDMQPRLSELEFEAEAIGGAFQRSEQENACLNIRMRAANRIVNLLRDENQFDEEQFWMNKARHLHNTLWLRDNPVRYLLWPVIRYIEFLLGSFARFIVVLALWILLFSWLYVASSDHGAWTLGLQDAITSFFSVGGPIHQEPMEAGTNKGPFWAWTVCGAISLGFIHLGIFVSHLYTLISRK